MPWILVDVLLVLLAIGLLALVGLRLWGRVRGLKTAIGQASATGGQAAAALAAAMADGPLGAGARPGVSGRSPGAHR